MVGAAGVLITVPPVCKISILSITHRERPMASTSVPKHLIGVRHVCSRRASVGVVVVGAAPLRARRSSHGQRGAPSVGGAPEGALEGAAVRRGAPCIAPVGPSERGGHRAVLQCEGAPGEGGGPRREPLAGPGEGQGRAPAQVVLRQVVGAALAPGVSRVPGDGHLPAQQLRQEGRGGG